ncbi:hypothetical protein Tther_01537 [Tepidimonas thermarum]|uniref:DUF2062 domain-containing protein n=1 Tax=Tepidimonas thermarum TaxID=335431 RepID=A0A554X0N0_9BURK|nr:DUF2062 domain-containing protein [Tepidimonas thermarum]TSE29373.1 hypothetical protein Tther_01537 [Tepidimonas thermarum]
MKDRLQSLLPSRERLHAMRWLRWLTPYLHHPRLWHLNRRGLALGLALGVFFGLLIPVAQIPASATLAVLLRANLPAAVASTLVTNPVTFGPVYFGAYKLGAWVLQAPASDKEAQAVQAMTASAAPEAPPQDAERSTWDWLADTWDWMTDVGKPLVVGLLIVATLAGVLVYGAVHALWVLKVRRARQRRRRQRAGRSGPAARTAD